MATPGNMAFTVIPPGKEALKPNAYDNGVEEESKKTFGKVAMFGTPPGDAEVSKFWRWRRKPKPDAL